MTPFSYTIASHDTSGKISSIKFPSLEGQKQRDSINTANTTSVIQLCNAGSLEISKHGELGGFADIADLPGWLLVVLLYHDPEVILFKYLTQNPTWIIRYRILKSDCSTALLL